MKELMKEYRETLKQLEKAKEDAVEADVKVIKEMISDIEYALEWMRTAKQPGAKRGIERRAAYERETACDPLLMQRYFRSTPTKYEWDKEEKENVISEWERIMLDDALSTLSESEREIYIMFKGYCFSMGEISILMNKSKSTVQTVLRRADEKIGKQIKESLFCMVG
ncbi:sigma factor-like helix-turn-helix DNA-binding protein [Bacillus cereus group sp. BfR-BA-01360]|uniref:sigma factor-like helix-turn-helix DNA-binding protein n=1 Tax=Bacillus cereus group sp. BfR-BA-01360 TaxID=2920321 RepID=UPI001F598BF9|nr:sigma factor-like helix-turn-helix DNA-binding protein [Bacillus cereus group sp. BfR-BA-01360]